MLPGFTAFPFAAKPGFIYILQGLAFGRHRAKCWHLSAGFLNLHPRILPIAKAYGSPPDSVAEESEG